jgi:pyruvate dehydrogenase E2 component (dihydrolipoamide acetyltransferase)
MEEGTFADWLKRDGEKVQAGDPLFAVESDKVTMDVESLDSGILYLPPGAPQSGAVVRAGQLIGYLLAEGEAAPGPSILAAFASEPTSGAPVIPLPGSVPVTPRARRVAAELGVETPGLRGSGKGGRIREQDVREAAQQRAPQLAIPVTAMRRTIADRMMESRRHSAPVTLTCRVDASRLVALRNRWKLALGQTPAPSFTDIVAKLVAIALAQHPVLGGRWEDDRIALPSSIHIGIAVDTDHGLLVPVIRNVPDLTLEEVARRSRSLIGAARRREIKAEDLQGGIFTITNLGGFGVEAFTPIINFPETAVLGLGAIRWEAVVLHTGQIAAREQIALSLTFDHRVVDGAPAARFLQTVAGLIEEPPAAVHCP